MSYINNLNAFKICRKIKPLSANAGWLYFVLFEYNNELGFQRGFTVANSTLQGISSLSENGLRRARVELIQKRYIKYKKGSGNKCGTYELVDLLNLIPQFDGQSDGQSDGQTDGQTDGQSDGKATTLNRQRQREEKIELKENKKENEQQNKTSLKKKLEKTKEAKLFEEYAKGNNELLEALTQYSEIRPKAFQSEEQIKRFLKKLSKFGSNDDEKIEVLDNSIVGGYQGIFELKNKGKKQSSAVKEDFYNASRYENNAWEE